MVDSDGSNDDYAYLDDQWYEEEERRWQEERDEQDRISAELEEERRREEEDQRYYEQQYRHRVARPSGVYRPRPRRQPGVLQGCLGCGALLLLTLLVLAFINAFHR